MTMIRKMAVVGLGLVVATSGLLMGPSTLRAQDQEFRATGPQGGAIGAGRNIGVGLGLGTFAAGLTGKYYLSSSSALQAHLGAGLAFGHAAAFGLNVDYVYEPGALMTAGAGSLIWGVGGGGAVFGGGHGGGIAINGVLQIGWHFSTVPIEVVLDYRPHLAVGSGGAGLGLFSLGLSGRYFF